MKNDAISSVFFLMITWAALGRMAWRQLGNSWSNSKSSSVSWAGSWQRRWMDVESPARFWRWNRFGQDVQGKSCGM